MIWTSNEVPYPPYGTLKRKPRESGASFLPRCNLEVGSLPFSVPSCGTGDFCGVKSHQNRSPPDAAQPPWMAGMQVLQEQKPAFGVSLRASLAAGRRSRAVHGPSRRLSSCFRRYAPALLAPVLSGIQGDKEWSTSVNRRSMFELGEFSAKDRDAIEYTR